MPLRYEFPRHRDDSCGIRPSFGIGYVYSKKETHDSNGGSTGRRQERIRGRTARHIERAQRLVPAIAYLPPSRLRARGDTPVRNRGRASRSWPEPISPANVRQVQTVFSETLTRPFAENAQRRCHRVGAGIRPNYCVDNPGYCSPAGVVLLYPSRYTSHGIVLWTRRHSV
jgi:hypothetical protein